MQTNLNLNQQNPLPELYKTPNSKLVLSQNLIYYVGYIILTNLLFVIILIVLYSQSKMSEIFFYISLIYYIIFFILMVLLSVLVKIQKNKSNNVKSKSLLISIKVYVIIAISLNVFLVKIYTPSDNSYLQNFLTLISLINLVFSMSVFIHIYFSLMELLFHIFFVTSFLIFCILLRFYLLDQQIGNDFYLQYFFFFSFSLVLWNKKNKNQFYLEIERKLLLLKLKNNSHTKNQFQFFFKKDSIYKLSNDFNSFFQNLVDYHLKIEENKIFLELSNYLKGQSKNEFELEKNDTEEKKVPYSTAVFVEEDIELSKNKNHSNLFNVSENPPNYFKEKKNETQTNDKSHQINKARASFSFRKIIKNQDFSPFSLPIVRDTNGINISSYDIERSYSKNPILEEESIYFEILKGFKYTNFSESIQLKFEELYKNQSKYEIQSFILHLLNMKNLSKSQIPKEFVLGPFLQKSSYFDIKEEKYIILNFQKFKISNQKYWLVTGKSLPIIESQSQNYQNYIEKNKKITTKEMQRRRSSFAKNPRFLRNHSPLNSKEIENSGGNSPVVINNINNHNAVHLRMNNSSVDDTIITKKLEYLDLCIGQDLDFEFGSGIKKGPILANDPRIACIIHDFKNIIIDFSSVSWYFLETLPIDLKSQYLSEFENISILKDYLLFVIRMLTSFIEKGEFFVKPAFHKKGDFIQIIEMLANLFRKRLAYDNTHSSVFSKKELKINPLIHEIDPMSLEIASCRYDRDLLLSLLYNIISNSYKYTDVGNICIELKEEKLGKNNNYLVINVKDTGRGIPENILSNWGKTFNFDNSEKGSGLGQYIINSIAKNMSIIVNKPESKVGVGTTFKILFPLHDNSVKNIEHEGRRISMVKPKKKSSNFITRYSIKSYYILCLDDYLPVLSNTENFLRKNLTIKGLNLIIKKCLSSHDVINEINLYLKAGLIFDLFIFDFNIGEDINGLELAELCFNIYRNLMRRFEFYQLHVIFLTEENSSHFYEINNSRYNFLKRDQIFSKTELGMLADKVQAILVN